MPAPKAAPVADVERDLITIPDAAKRLGLHRDSAYRMAVAGTFPGGAAIRIGERRWVVSVPRLNRYLHGADELAS